MLNINSDPAFSRASSLLQKTTKEEKVYLAEFINRIVEVIKPIDLANLSNEHKSPGYVQHSCKYCISNISA